MSDSIFQPSFPSSFDPYVVEGEYLTTFIEGVEYQATIEYDRDANIDDDDVHNPDPEVTGCNEQQQRELIEARKAWFRNEWFYGGVVISAHKAGVMLTNNAASLWGIECNYPGTKNEYLTEVANNLLLEAVGEANRILEELRA
jgi:hypothetical protein